MQKKYFYLGVALIMVSAASLCATQLIWKIATQSTTPIPLYILGFFLFGLGGIFMILAFKFGKLSILQPMNSFNCVIAVVLGVMILGEQLSVEKVVGTLFICVGILILIIFGSKESRVGS